MFKKGAVRRVLARAERAKDLPASSIRSVIPSPGYDEDDAS